MPPVQVYSVDFSNGNLVPSLDSNGWGPMKQGNSGASGNPGSYADARGLNLSVYRAPGATTAAANGVSVVLAPNVLPLASRLSMRVEVDRPNAHLQYIPQPSTVTPPSAAPGSPTPEPWAVALTVKFGDENMVDGEPLVSVTSQFNRQMGGGVRLNTPFNEQGDKASNLMSPLDYAVNPPPVLLMEHVFCGTDADGLDARAVGSGHLTIGPPGTRQDQRVYSNVNLPGGIQSWIGALSVELVTISGTGQIMVRLRKFSISTWS